MRLGIFGGSFDPVHNGHLLLAECCWQALSLDEVWFLPAACQPLKPDGPLAADDQRLTMLRLATASRPEFVVSKLELDRGGVSYTVETLAEIHAAKPQSQLFFLLGADSLDDLPHWRKPERICELAIPAAVRRAGHPEPSFEAIRSWVSPARLAEIQAAQVEMPATPISSSEIRQLIAAGRDDTWEELVPEPVAQYVREQRLYQSNP